MAIEVNTTNDLDPTDEEFAAIAAASASITNAAQSADTIFKANAALAAKEIAALALGAANERVRLDASKYIVERVMGRLPDAKAIDGDAGAPWDGVYGAIVVKEPSAAQRGQGARVTQAAPQSQV